MEDMSIYTTSFAFRLSGRTESNKHKDLSSPFYRILYQP